MQYNSFLWKKLTNVNKLKRLVAKIAKRGAANAKFNYKWPVRGSSLAL